MIEHLVVIVTSTIFGLQHSGISALRVKEGIINKWGKEGYSKIGLFTVNKLFVSSVERLLV